MVLSSSSNWVGTPEFDLQEVIGKLTHGRNKADQLRDMLLEIIRGSAGPAEAQVMVGQILDTFAQSLEMLTAGAADSVGEVSQVPADTKALSRRKMEDSGDSCKTPAPKDRRGCYKRRKTEETLIKETPDFFEDGNAWRKYGQKKILNSKHPRNYYRCTHKFDQGCRATKQVQKIQDDPPLIRTTYLGHHTCTNLDIKSTHHQIMMDAAAPDSSIIWSFAQSGGHGDYKPDTRMLITPAVLNAPNKLQENKEEPDHQQHIQSSNSPFYDHGDCFFQDDELNDELTTFDTSDHDVISSGGLSCSASNYNSMDLDLDEIFKFDSKGLY